MSNLAKDSLVAISFGMLVFLIGNFLIYNPKDPYHFGQWSINPIWDILYLRTGGPLLYGNHEIVGLALCAIPIYYCIKERSIRRLPIWLCCMFATVFLHEVVIQSFGAIPYGILIVHQLFNSYMLILGVFAALAFVFGTPFQKRILIYVAILCLCTSAPAMILYRVFNYYPMTLSTFSPGPQIFDFWANLFEDIYWYIPISIWFWQHE